MKSSVVMSGLVVASLFAMSPSANANNLVNGATNVAPDVFDLTSPPLVLQTSISGTYQLKDAGGDVLADGTYGEVVFLDPNNNLGGACSGKCLDFVFFFSNVSSDIAVPDDVQRVTTLSFAGFLADAGYDTGCGNIANPVLPTSMDRSSSGDTIGFNTNVAPGQMSECLVVETNATNWTTGDLNFIDGGIASVAGFAPVPGPVVGAGLPGLIFACGGLLALARRRRRGLDVAA